MWIRFELKAPSVYLLTHVQHAVQNDLLHFVLAVLCNMIFASLRCSRGFFGWGIIGTVRRSVWSLNNATPLRFPASLFGHLALMGPYSSLFTMYLSLSIQPLSLSAFYSKANLAQAAHFFFACTVSHWAKVAKPHSITCAVWAVSDFYSTDKAQVNCTKG